LEEGKSIELDKVLLINSDDGTITAGNPTIEGAKVTATSKGEGKAKKIIVFKYKPKTRYRVKNGHRQYYTRLAIDHIFGPGAEVPKPKRVRKTVKKAVTPKVAAEAPKEVTEEVTENGS